MWIGCKRNFEKKDDWRYWVSISDILTLLTEASPDEFLNKLSEICQKEEMKVFLKYLNKKTILLLEAVTMLPSSGLWSYVPGEKDYLKRVTEILLLMSQHEDSSSNWANKPSRTLQNLYRLQMPQTSCGFNEKLEILILF